ncbi:MAG TPA: hypothetical protein VMW48_05845 [Vicinamibacterales bacterium]|nr:hypothetical protein [Vicinamibacterales bacterium]
MLRTAVVLLAVLSVAAVAHAQAAATSGVELASGTKAGVQRVDGSTTSGATAGAAVGALWHPTRQVFGAVIAAPTSQPAAQPAAMTQGKNQLGVNYVLAYRREPNFELAADGVLRNSGTVYAESSGVEVFYGRRIFTSADGLAAAVDLPVMLVPKVKQAPLPEFFGLEPDYRATYFTPRISFEYPHDKRWRLVVALGGGVARFSETLNGESHSETRAVVHLAGGMSIVLRRHWALRAGYLAYGPERRLEGLTVGIARVF